MAKRFTDSRKFDDPFYRKLPIKMKVAFEYLVSKCNHAGIYKIDLDVMAFYVGAKITLDDIFKYLGNKVYQISDEKLFIPRFISFQYNDITANNKVCGSVRALLKSEQVLGSHKISPEIYNCMDLFGFYTVSKPLPKGYLTLKDKVKVKVKENTKTDNFILSSLEEYLFNKKDVTIFMKDTMKVTQNFQERWLVYNTPSQIVDEIEKFKNYLEANGKTYKNYNAAFSNWLKSPYRKKTDTVLERPKIKRPKDYVIT